MLVREIVRALPGATKPTPMLIDLGCGTGAAGAAWAIACGKPPRLVGIDRHPWTLHEAARTYRDFGLIGRTHLGDVANAPLPRSRASILAAFTINEVAGEDRDRLKARLLDRAARGDRVLIVEPVSRRAAPWWDDWRKAFIAAGGRADDWRIRVDLPPIVAKLDRASGLNHRELTGRSLWIS
jgi:ubiquinone/menaquinone biosynthesis C-methylase UbiE